MNDSENRFALYGASNLVGSESLVPDRPEARRLKRRDHAGWMMLGMVIVCLSGAVAQAGFTMELNLIRANPYGYSFSPNLTTNGLAPNGPYGDYYVASPGFPTNGAAVSYHYDANGLTWGGSSSWEYGDFNGVIRDLAQGPWSITFSNQMETNVYYFNVTANIASNDLPLVRVIYPVNGQSGVATQPPFEWVGPANYTDAVVYYGTNSASVAIMQSNWSAWTLPDGTNSFSVHYDEYDTNSLASTVPLDARSNPLAAWSSIAHLHDYAAVQFVVDPPVVFTNSQIAGGNLRLSFVSETSFTHNIQFRTNLSAGADWQTYTNALGDGTLKTVAVPLSLFEPAQQGFVRVATQ